MEGKQHTRVTRNKDILLLQSVRFISQELESIRERERRERDQLAHITKSISAAPRGGSGKGLDDAFAAIERLAEKHAALAKKYEKTIRRAEQKLEKIASAQMRTFVTLLYLDGMRDAEVRRRLNMSRWQFEQARSLVEQAESMKKVRWDERYIGGEPKEISQREK